MEALDALLNRVSAPRLLDPAPTAEQREVLFAAALRAPDHGQLRPYRFLTIEGDARNQLGEILAQAVQAQAGDVTQAALDKARAMPLRAPLVVVVVARLQEHLPKNSGLQLLGGIRNLNASRLAVLADLTACNWKETDFFALALQSNERFQRDDQVLTHSTRPTPWNGNHTSPSPLSLKTMAAS